MQYDDMLKGTYQGKKLTEFYKFLLSNSSVPLNPCLWINISKDIFKDEIHKILKISINRVVR